MLLIGCAKQPWWLLCDLCIFTQWPLEGVLVEGNRWVGTRVLQCSEATLGGGASGRGLGPSTVKAQPPALPPGEWRVSGDCAYGVLLS